MADERFDAIVVGAGPAGAAAALTMARGGLQVALIERGEFPGAKNLFGGVIYRHQLAELIPEFWKEAPLERAIVEQRMCLLSEEGVVTVGHRNERFKDPPNCWTGLRVKFDAWFAGKAEKAGVVPIYQTVVTELLRDGNKVIGVRTDRENGDLLADIVILADGVNSLLGKSIGVHREWQPNEVSLAVKEIIRLPKEKIEDRFNLESGEGCTLELLGGTMDMAGLGFLYTNVDTLSLGVGVMVNDLRRRRIKPYAVLDALKQHPYIRRLIAGGEVVEYSGHLIPEAGYASMPPLSGDGWMICGDAAQMVNVVHREGTNLALTSGRLAGETAIAAHQQGVFTFGVLEAYDRALRKSFVNADLKKYRGMHGLMTQEHPEVLFRQLPDAANEAGYQWLSVDGNTKKFKQKQALRTLIRATGGRKDLLRLVMRGWRAMNG